LKTHNKSSSKAFFLILLIFGGPNWAAVLWAKPLSLTTIDQQLSAAETLFNDIVENTEKTIRWFDEKQKTAISIVYLHGFSATRKELSPVTENLADRLRANIYFARLRGHGRSDDAMAEATKQDWLNDTKLAYEIGQLIGDQVILVSASTGGTLATWLCAQTFATKLKANIMISPNFGIKSRIGEIARWNWGLQVVKWLNGPYYSFTPMNELHAKYWTERYPVEALMPMLKLVDSVLDMDKSAIKTPQLIVYSPNDQVINVDRISVVQKQMSNAKVTLVPFTTSRDRSQHVLAGDATSPKSTEEIVEILYNYLKIKQ